MFKPLPFILFFSLLAGCDAASDVSDSVAVEKQGTVSPAVTGSRQGKKPAETGVIGELNHGSTKLAWPKAGDKLIRNSDGRVVLAGWQDAGSAYWGEDVDECCVVEFWRDRTALLVLTDAMGDLTSGTGEPVQVLDTHTLSVGRDEVVSVSCRVDGNRAVIGLWDKRKQWFRAVFADGEKFFTHEQRYEPAIGDPDIDCRFDKVSGPYGSASGLDGGAVYGLGGSSMDMSFEGQIFAE